MAANTEETYRKTWNAKYTLRSHFDGVRSLVSHPTDPVLITASDDHTLKLWNLHKTVPSKKYKTHFNLRIPTCIKISSYNE